MQRNRAFTLIEMLMVVIIASVLMAAATPMFRSIIQNNRAAAFSADFIRAIYFTRNEAIKRGTPVSMCASNTTQTACDASGDWTNGWIVFVDQNADGTYQSANDILLTTHDTLDASGTITAAAVRITYSAQGFLRAGNGAYQLAATGCKGKNGRTVSISNSGRVAIQVSVCS